MLSLSPTPLKALGSALRAMLHRDWLRREQPRRKWLSRLGSILLLLCVTFQTSAPALHAATNVPACGFAEIKGIVFAEDSELPLGEIEVTAEGAVVEVEEESNSSGAYTLTLPVYQDQGPYTIKFVPPRDSPYLSDEESVGKVVSGTTKSLDEDLPRGGTIHGQVRTADTGEPMAGVDVRASGRTILDDFDPMVTSTKTDAQGRYVLHGLIDGEYVLRYDPHDFSASAVISPYVQSFVGGASLLDATLYTVTAPNTITVNITIPRGQTLAGEVRRGDNDAPASKVLVSLYRPDEDGSGHGEGVQGTMTDAQGVYRLFGLAPGSYLLYARAEKAILGPQLPNADLKPEWYEDAIYSEDAELIVIPEVSSAQVVSLNLTLDVGATITGVVTDAETGAPVEGIGVEVRPPIGLGEVSRTRYEVRTDASGAYSLTGLHPGSYGIIWDGVFSEYGGLGRDPFTGISLTVAGAGVTPNANFAIQKVGEIEGALTDTEGDPVADVEVSLVVSSTGRVLRQVSSNGAGEYFFSGVAPGDYLIKYDRYVPCGCYTNEYYGEAGEEAAGVVTVAPSETTAEINQQLACDAPPSVLEQMYLPAVRP